jgi:DNA repair photolyase
MKIKKVECKTIIGKCGFPGGGLAINPYVGCEHDCAYCYARFIKRFSGHDEEWGKFVDIRSNAAEVLKKQMKSAKYKGQPIYIGTVTDPYQQAEEKYKITRSILEVLKDYANPVSILTKSDLVLRDLDLLKQFKRVDINFTVNTLDEKWKKLVEPNSPSIADKLKAMRKLTKEGISVYAMMGPYWPIFTDPEKLFAKFKEAGVKHVYTESLNTIGGNWVGVEKMLRKNYPQELKKMKEILFNKEHFFNFYNDAQKKVKELSKKYNLPTTIYFGLGHAAKFKK